MPHDPLCGQAVHEPIRRLPNFGFAATVVVALPWTPFPLAAIKTKWAAYNRVPLKATIGGVQVYYPRYRTYPRHFRWRTAGQRMYDGIETCLGARLRADGYELVHAHTGFPDGIAAAALAREFNVPLALTLRGTDVDIVANPNFGGVRMLAQVIEQAAVVIVPSPRLKDKVFELFGIEAAVVENGFSPLDIQPENDRRLRQVIRIASVSRLLTTKRLDLLIRSVHALLQRGYNVECTIVGDGPAGARLKKLVEDLGVSERIRLLGHQPRNVVAGVLADCDVFALPSVQETFGIAYLEAMAMGRPVIACRGQGIDGIVEDGVSAVLVKPNDADDVVRAIRCLAENSDLRKRIGENGRGIARALTWEATAEKLAAHYRIAMCTAKP